MRVSLSTTTGFLLAAATPALGAAQVTTVDRGAFSITRDGTPVGREEFEIRTQPGVDGATLEARGTTVLDGRTVTTALTTNAAGTPVSYRLEVRTGGDVAERASGMAAPGRLRIDAQSAGGRAAREFPSGEGTLVLDDGVFHQYHFVALRVAAGGPLTAVVPRRNAQGPVRVSGRSSERIAVGGREIAATRLDLDGGARALWVDAEGRVLRVSAGGLVAQRDEPPR